MDKIFKGGFFRGYHTETAGTVITEVIPPKLRAKSRITRLVYEAGTTAHTPRILMPLARTTLTAAAAASQAVINVAAVSLTPTATPQNPSPSAESIAASDYLIFKNADGGYDYGIVSSVSSLAITLTASLATALVSGAPVWCCYELGRNTHLTVDGTASAFTTMEDPIAGLCTSWLRDSPLLFHSGNATAAGFLHHLGGYYTAI